MTALDVLKEFIEDVERAYPSDIRDELADEWPDLLATYEMAKAFVEKKGA